jgi:hypothetical protein
MHDRNSSITDVLESLSRVPQRIRGIVQRIAHNVDAAVLAAEIDLPIDRDKRRARGVKFEIGRIAEIWHIFASHLEQLALRWSVKPLRDFIDLGSFPFFVAFPNPRERLIAPAEQRFFISSLGASRRRSTFVDDVDGGVHGHSPVPTACREG